MLPSKASKAWARAAEHPLTTVFVLALCVRLINLALLTGRAFAKSRPTSQRTWHIRLSDAGAQAVCEQPRQRMTFDRKTFAADPRIRALSWERS